MAGAAKDEVLARADQLALLEIEPEQLRVEVARLLQDSLTWADANACKASVRATYETFAAARPLNLQPGIGRRLIIPTKVWEFWASRTEGLFAGSHVEGVRWGHVHGVKGEEFDAVVLAVPSRAARDHTSLTTGRTTRAANNGGLCTWARAGPASFWSWSFLLACEHRSKRF